MKMAQDNISTMILTSKIVGLAARKHPTIAMNRSYRLKKNKLKIPIFDRVTGFLLLYENANQIESFVATVISHATTVQFKMQIAQRKALPMCYRMKKVLRLTDSLESYRNLTTLTSNNQPNPKISRVAICNHKNKRKGQLAVNIRSERQ
jgi:hypothetical protein